MCQPVLERVPAVLCNFSWIVFVTGNVIVRI